MKPEVSQWSVRSLEIISRCTSLLFRLQPTPRRSQPRPRLASAAAQFETSWTLPSARLQPITSQPIVERSMAIAASAAWNTPAASSQPIVEQSKQLRLSLFAAHRRAEQAVAAHLPQEVIVEQSRAVGVSATWFASSRAIGMSGAGDVSAAAHHRRELTYTLQLSF